MSVAFHDLVGTTGVCLILFCYFFLQVGKMQSQQLSYILLNMLGACLILFSLYFEFNLSAMLIESAWVVISLVGLYRYYRANKGGTKRSA